MITFYLARHGQTDWNKNKRFQSRNNIPLNSNGMQQADQLKAKFNEKHINFDFVFSSPLDRALTTASILTDKEKPNITTDERLLEINMGDFEGRFEKDLEQELGESFDVWRNDIFIKAAPNGESLSQACQRVKDFLMIFDDEKYQNKTILIVAHQGTNVALQTVLSDAQQPFTNELHKYKQHNDEVNVWQGDIWQGKVNELPMTWVEKIKL